MQKTATRDRQAQTVRINDYLWRVTASDGFVYGHIERIPTPQGDRFEAKRYRLSAARFISIGRFWSFDDAVDCLRFG
ncbi:hypothetical protein [Paramicrobacterium agarici]|uniref:Uncharacterized protein n=1 Tax=Paramicrobacterium agarici TaxID=630514 RepID=A0A2A9DYB6_9MICO|nr:hypothetical protein [Microbacterium agarici]PFG31125.1 hypothetical protein ATJ78_2075 [Microbacterium agarici]TQO24196.1 hypothetical protein FB385_3072 [Microbacterium agarici]